MSGLSNLNKRLKYQGGNTEGRMKKDKLKSLKSTLFNSYQAQTAVLEDGREFKCLINENKNSPDYDNKIISIPYEDICLNPDVNIHQKTSKGIESIGLKTGHTFTWKETDTHWLVFLEYLEEDAYFMAQIRRCDQQVEVNNKKYWTYIRGPVETTVSWNQKGGVEWNDLNYSLVMYITNDENTADYFHRFKQVKITDPATGKKHTWQVEGRNAFYGDGIIELFLKEDYDNTIKEEAEKEQTPPPKIEVNKSQPYIDGPRTAKIYDKMTFTAHNFTETNCKWYIKDGEKITEMNESSTTLVLDALKKGSVTITYKGVQQSYSIDVTIEKM